MNAGRKGMKISTGAMAMLILLAGCHAQDKGAEAGTKTVEAEAMTLGLGGITLYDATPGTVVSEQQVQVASRLMGYIRDMPVREGDAVKSGQLLFTIDPTDIEGQVSQAKAGLAQAQAGLADAKADFERFSNLYKDESIPKLQFDKVKLQYSVAQSQERAARAGLDTAQSQLRYANVRSPIEGVVTQNMASKGDLASPGHPVLVVENQQKLMVQTTVSDETYAHLKLGGGALIEIGGKQYKGVISRLVAASDAMSHTHLVKLEVPDAKGLVSGSFARVSFDVGMREGILIPRSAILERAGITGVFVVDEKGIASYRMVRKGSEQNGMVAIEAGLNPGEKLVVAKAGELDSGDKVTLTEGRSQ
jgi:RND family efflux transporter MFP subunit